MFSFIAYVKKGIPSGAQHKPHFFPKEKFGVSWDLRYDQGASKKVPARFYNAYKTDQHTRDIIVENPPTEWEQWIDKWAHKIIQWSAQEDYQNLKWVITTLIAIIAIAICSG